MNNNRNNDEKDSFSMDWNLHRHPLSLSDHSYYFCLTCLPPINMILLSFHLCWTCNMKRRHMGKIFRHQTYENPCSCNCNPVCDIWPKDWGRQTGKTNLTSVKGWITLSKQDVGKVKQKYFRIFRVSRVLIIQSDLIWYNARYNLHYRFIN